MKIPTKAMTLCRPRDPVARWAGSSAEPAAETSPGRRSHATETESGREESGQRLRAAGGEAERVSAAARKPARPKRRQAAEKAGEESSRRSAPARREEGAEEAKKTFGELSMAAGGEGRAGPPPLRATPARAPRRRRWSDRSSGSWGLGEGGAAERVERGGGHGRLEAQLVEPSRGPHPIGELG